MDINNIKVIISASGAVFVGQDEIKENCINISLPGKIKLKYPFRFMLDQTTGSLKVAAPVLKEEWAIIDMNGSVEVQLNPTIEDTYRTYCEKIFGSGIIMPDTKKVIV